MMGTESALATTVRRAPWTREEELGQARADVLDAIRAVGVAQSAVRIATVNLVRLQSGHVQCGGGWWVRRPRPARY